MTFSKVVLLAALACAVPATGADAPAAPSAAIQIDAGQLVWRAAPPSLPAGIETAVLEGDPRAAGVFTMRLRAPAGTRLAPHTHPQPERVTVLAGAIGVGFGTRHEASRLKMFRSGDFYVNPPGQPHFVEFGEDSVIQVTGEGPWKLDYLQP
jgi:quercetin dioxygenase-like cupin family protein